MLVRGGGYNSGVFLQWRTRRGWAMRFFFYTDMQCLLKQLREQNAEPKWFVKLSRPQKINISHFCEIHVVHTTHLCSVHALGSLSDQSLFLQAPYPKFSWWAFDECFGCDINPYPALQGQQSFGKPFPRRQEHFLGQAEATAHSQDDAVHLGWFSRNLWNKGKEFWCWWGSGKTKVQNSSLSHWHTAQGI